MCLKHIEEITDVNLIDFNFPLASLKPRNEGIAELIRYLASELQKGLSFKCVRLEKYRPENRSNPPFCFAVRSGKKRPFYNPVMPTKYCGHFIVVISQALCTDQRNYQEKFTN